jgi:hypothetical protein
MNGNNEQFNKFEWNSEMNTSFCIQTYLCSIQLTRISFKFISPYFYVIFKQLVIFVLRGEYI